MELEEIIKTFLKEKDQRVFDALEPEERDIVLSMLQQYKSSGASPLLKECWDLDYDRRPPTLTEFIEDPYYLGATCGESLFPIWKEKLAEDLSPMSKKITLVFTGPIGIGKTYTGLAALLYKMTLLLLMKNPQRFYGLDRGSGIVFGIYAPTLAQASLAGWGTCLGFLKNSPFFQSMGVDPTQEYKKGEIQFPNNIKLLAGSKTIHTLGGNLFGHLMDETDFRIEADGDGAAHQIHTSLMRRMESRFMQKGGVIPGISILCSSANSQSGFLSKFIDNNKETETVAIHDHPIWEVKAHTGIYSGHTFKVDAGSATHNPSIMTKPHADEATVSQALADMHPSARIIDVPIEYYEQFESDIIGSIKDIAGCRVASTFRFFSNPELILRNYDESIYNPVQVDAVPMTISNERHIHEYVDADKLFVIKRGIAQPRIHPECVRFAHLDLSKTGDSTGLVVGHLWRGGSSVVIDDKNSNLPVTLNSGHFYTDIVMEIKGAKGDPIDYSKIRAFLLWLRKSGMHLNTVSMDDYQSTDMIQILNKHGVNSKYLSCDTKRQPYEYLKNAFKEDRITLPNHELLRDELLYLIDKGKKIDHEVKSADYVPEGPACFLGSTKIKLLDGRSLSFEELNKEYGPTEHFWVYSQKIGAKGKIHTVPGKAKNSRITARGVTKLVRITLDDGTVEEGCSLDHRWMLYNGEYCEAQNLKVGDSLRPLYLRNVPISNKKGAKDYTQFQRPETKGWHRVHRMAHGPTTRGNVIHHIDFNRFNNRPDNLVEMTRRDHLDLHVSHAHLNFNSEAFRAGAQKWNLSEEGRKYHSDFMKKLWEDPEYRKKQAEKSSEIGKITGPKTIKVFNDKRTEEKDTRVLESLSKEDFVSLVNAHVFIEAVCRESGIAYYDLRRLQKLYFGYENWNVFVKAEFASRHKEETQKQSAENSRKGAAKNVERMQKIRKQYLDSISLTKEIFDLNVQKYVNRKEIAKHTAFTESDLNKAGREYYSDCLKDHNIIWTSMLKKHFIFDDIEKRSNHKVAKVEIYETEPVDLWDIEVEEYSNFALETGVFVHNSKDISDALCGALYMALTTPYTQVDMPMTSHLSVEKEPEVNFSGMGYGSSLLDNPKEYLDIEREYEMANE